MLVADYTSPELPPLNIRVTWNSASDILCALWFVADRMVGCELEDLDVGDEWLGELEADLSEATLQALAEIGSGDVWVALLPLLADMSSGASISDFIGYLEQIDPADLRLTLMKVHDKFPRVDQELVADAAEGDMDAVETLLSIPEFDNKEMKRWRDSLRFLLSKEPEALRTYLVGIVRSTHDEAFAEREAEFRPFLEADYRAKRSMARRVSPERLLDVATHGIQIADSRAYRPMVLLPTMVARPWVVFAQGPDSFVLGYPVAAETLNPDPDAPPEWLVKMHKALGDEKRLRALRVLADGDASLADLADKIDMPKSSLHHHMMLLRTAGLVQVHVGKDKKYSLRDEAIGDASAYLAHYIHNSQDERETGS